MNRPFRGAALAALVLLGAACGATTVDDDLVPTTSPPATTAPTGAVDDLLSRLTQRSLTLSTAIVDGKAAAVIAEIDSLWTAAAAQLPRTAFTESVQSQIDQLHAAVERRRPADADKTARNLQALVATLP